MSLQLSPVKTLNICNGSNGDSSVSSNMTTDRMSTCELDTGGEVQASFDRGPTSTSDCTGVTQSRDPASSERGRLQEPLPQILVERVEIGSITSSDDSSSIAWYHPSFPPSYHGFINLVTMEPANQSSAEGVRVKSHLLHPVKSLYERPLPELLKNLDNRYKKEDRGEVIRMLQVDLLPLLAKQKQLSEISECLMIEEAGLQRIVCSFLEEILLSLPRSHDVSATKGLLDVAEKSMSVLMKSTDDEDNVLSFMSLHLMAVSAIFIRSQKPELEKCSSFILSPKEVNKIAHGGIKQSVFKSLNQFYERFKEEVDELSSLPDWTRAACSPVEQNKVKDKCSRASFCKLVMYAFSILNEVALKGWSPVSIDLLGMLKMVHEVAVLRTGKPTMIQESRSMFDFLIIRGLIVLLNTTFSEDKELVGESQNGHPASISHLITEVINCRHGTTQRERLLREVRGPTFHKATRVRQTFNILHRADETQLEDLAHGYIEQSLRGFGFRFDETRRAKDKGDDAPAVACTCNWITSPCKVSGIKGDCAMYVPTVNCMVKEDFTIETCLEEHPVKEFASLSGRHKQNLKMLQLLSPKVDRVSKLLAYQYKPFPFYITEAVEEEDRLLSYLRSHRRQGFWLSTESVVGILQQILDILLLLQNEGLVSRDLTCYNLVVRENGKSGSGKTKCQILKACENFTIQLADLSLVHEYRNKEDICIVRDPGPVPLRWTAPEALFEGRYSPKSAIWAFGCVMQEIATYGCEPYTSYNNMTTEQILKKMKLEPGSIKLFHWPFIQCELFSLIEKCTKWDPEERPSFAQVKEELSSIQATGSFGELPLEEALSKEGRYPTPSNSQIVRRHVPEKGIPKSVQQLIDARKTSELYRNTRVLSWHCKPHTAIEQGELFTSDSIDIEIKNDVTRVKEKLREKFVNGELRLIESSKLPVKCWADGEQGLVRLIQHDGHHVHEREYGASKILKDIVAKGDFWSDDDDNYNKTSGEPTILCLSVLTSLANAMCQQHSQGWLFRDFRASNVLVDCSTGKAFLARIGRMRHLRDTEDSLVEEPFPDSWRRLAPEVLVGKTYSRASDVFMFGTMIWELFNIREITRINPKARNKDFEPCAGIPKHEVINFVREGTPLSRHELCPLWLYELILDCRHPNPAQRPTAEHVSRILSNKSVRGAAVQPLMLRCVQSTVQETPTDADTPEPPEVPAPERPSISIKLLRKRLNGKKYSERRVTFRSVRRQTQRKHKKGFDNPTFEHDNNNCYADLTKNSSSKSFLVPSTDSITGKGTMERHTKISIKPVKRSGSKTDNPAKRSALRESTTAPDSYVSGSRDLTAAQVDLLREEKRHGYTKFASRSGLSDVDQTHPKTLVADENIDDDDYDTLLLMETTSSHSFISEAPGLNAVQQKQHGNEYSHMKQTSGSSPPSGGKISVSNRPRDSGDDEHSVSVVPLRRTQTGPPEPNQTHRTVPSHTAPHGLAARPKHRKQTRTSALHLQTANGDHGCEMEWHGPEFSAIPQSSEEASGLDQHGHHTRAESKRKEPERYDRSREDWNLCRNAGISDDSCTREKKSSCRSGQCCGDVHAESLLHIEEMYCHPNTVEAVEAESCHVYLDANSQVCAPCGRIYAELELQQDHDPHPRDLDSSSGHEGHGDSRTLTTALREYVDAKSLRRNPELTSQVQDEVTHCHVEDHLTTCKEFGVQDPAHQSFYSDTSWERHTSIGTPGDCPNESYCSLCNQQCETMQAGRFNVTAMCLDKDPFRAKLLCEHKANMLKQSTADKETICRRGNENHEGFVGEGSDHAIGASWPAGPVICKVLDLKNKTIHYITQLELTEEEGPCLYLTDAVTDSSDDQPTVWEFREQY